MDVQVTSEPVVPTKSPLESRTVQVALMTVITALVGNHWPVVGDWLKAHQEEVLGGIAMATTWARSGGDRPLNWRDLTIKGFGIRF